MKQVDAVYGVKSYDDLTEAEKKQVDALFEKLDGMIDDEFVQVEPANPELETLYKQLDEIFGTPKELNAEEQKQADAIDAQISKLFEGMGEEGLSKADEAKLTELQGQLDKLHGVKSYDALTDQEKKTVDPRDLGSQHGVVLTSDHLSDF